MKHATVIQVCARRAEHAPGDAKPVQRDVLRSTDRDDLDVSGVILARGQTNDVVVGQLDIVRVFDAHALDYLRINIRDY